MAGCISGGLRNGPDYEIVCRWYERGGEVDPATGALNFICDLRWQPRDRSLFPIRACVLLAELEAEAAFPSFLCATSTFYLLLRSCSGQGRNSAAVGSLNRVFGSANPFGTQFTYLAPSSPPVRCAETPTTFFCATNPIFGHFSRPRQPFLLPNTQ